ncbi:MAG: SH3 domain-containing protein [Planctomycetota bacterium]
MIRPSLVAPLVALATCALAAPASAQGIYRVTATTLNVRSGPSTRYAVVGQVTRDQAVYVYRFTSGWAELSYRGQRRFASASYLRRNTPAPARPAPAPARPAPAPARPAPAPAPRPAPAPAPAAVTRTGRGSGSRTVGSSTLGAVCSRESVSRHSRATSEANDSSAFTGRLLGRRPRLGGARAQVRSRNSDRRIETKVFRLEVLGREFSVPSAGIEKSFPWFEDVTLWRGGLGPVGVALKVGAGISAGLTPRVALENGGVSVGTVASVSVYGEGKVELDALVVRGGIKGTLHVVEVSLPSGYTFKLTGITYSVDLVVSSNIGLSVYVIVGRKVFGIGYEKKFEVEIPGLQFTLAEIRVPIAHGRVVGS